MNEQTTTGMPYVAINGSRPLLPLLEEHVTVPDDMRYAPVGQQV